MTRSQLLSRHPRMRNFWGHQMEVLMGHCRPGLCGLRWSLRRWLTSLRDSGSRCPWTYLKQKIPSKFWTAQGPQCAGQNKMARNFKIADFTYMTLELWWVWVMSGNDEGGVRPSYWGRLQGFVKAWCQRRSCHLRRRLHPRNWWYFPEHRHQGSGIWSELRVCDCTRRTQGLVLKWDLNMRHFWWFSNILLGSK